MVNTYELEYNRQPNSNEIVIPSWYEDEEEYIESICEEDEDHIDSFKENNTYYIGVCYKDKRDNRSIIIDSSISNRLFLKYSSNIIYKVLGGDKVKYKDEAYNKLYKYWLYYHKNREVQLQIFKTDFKNLDQHPFEWELGVVIKTFWLRIVQRTWKRIYKERTQIIKKRMHPNNLHHRNIHGKWPSGLNHIPSLRDMKI
jgi:hypothetical protein